MADDHKLHNLLANIHNVLTDDGRNAGNVERNGHEITLPPAHFRNMLFNLEEILLKRKQEDASAQFAESVEDHGSFDQLDEGDLIGSASSSRTRASSRDDLAETDED